MPERKTTRPIGIALAYVSLGLAWFFLSDQLPPFTSPRSAAWSPWAARALLLTATGALLWSLLHRQRAPERQLILEELRAVLDGMADAVFVVDARHQITEVNEAAVQLVGASSRSELLGPLVALQSRLTVESPNSQPLRPSEFPTERALAGDPVSARELQMSGPSGRRRVVSVSSTPIPLRSRTPRFAVTVIRDLSEVTRFEEAREAFIASAAHEFRTPLAVVKAYAQLLEQRGASDPASLAAISRQVDRLTRMLERLLDGSRFRLGGAELQREHFDLAALLLEVADGLRDAVDGRAVIVTLKDDARGVTIFGDRRRISLVIARLVENALRFSPRGSSVEAQLSRQGVEAFLSVRDHGPGIPAERQAFVFERGYGAHGALPDFAAVSGALDVSREIVARHGGRIWLESTMGQGTTFTFSLPIAPEEGRP